MGSSGADPRDSDLVVAARAGQAWALTEIWQRHAPAVTGYLRGRGATEPEDTTSDVFLAVFERLHGFHGDDDALRSFVFTVAHHKMVDDLRRRNRRGESAAYDPGTDPRVEASAETMALEAIGDQRVDELLLMLSPDQREVLLLRVVADLSLEQTATVLGKRVGAVKALQHRALAALRRVMEQAVSL
jgi:RNA polymerase sigma-70 factor (ECF subfamily)